MPDGNNDLRGRLCTIDVLDYTSLVRRHYIWQNFILPNGSRQKDICQNDVCQNNVCQNDVCQNDVCQNGICHIIYYIMTSSRAVMVYSAECYPAECHSTFIKAAFRCINNNIIIFFLTHKWGE
jgi:hypothetical protein